MLLADLNASGASLISSIKLNSLVPLGEGPILLSLRGKETSITEHLLKASQKRDHSFERRMQF